MSKIEKFCHDMDRIFNHKRWKEDEKLMMQKKALNDTHDENVKGIDANKDINVEAAKNKVGMQNGYSMRQGGSFAQNMIPQDIR